MSNFISNKSCGMCHEIETGLVEMRVGNINHYLCYKCMATLALDTIEFAAHNLRNEFESQGYIISSTNEQGYIVNKIRV